MPTEEPGTIHESAEDVVQEMTEQQQQQQPSPQDLIMDQAIAEDKKNNVPDGGYTVGHPGSGVGETTLPATAPPIPSKPEPAAPPPPPPLLSAPSPPPPPAEDEGDKILDEIETSTPVDKMDDWNMDHLVEETRKSEERKKLMEKRHHDLQQSKLREQALKLQKKSELDQLVIEGEKKCSQWTSIHEESEAVLYDMFKEGVNSSLAARDE